MMCQPHHFLSKFLIFRTFPAYHSYKLHSYKKKEWIPFLGFDAYWDSLIKAGITLFNLLARIVSRHLKSVQSTDILRLSESFILLAFLGLLKNCTVENGHYKRGGRTLYKGGRTLKLGVPQFLRGVEIFIHLFNFYQKYSRTFLCCLA